MKRLTENELKATNRIFNHVNRLVGNYYGFKSFGETKDFASMNRWIMFPVHNASSLREGTCLPVPNIYLSFEDGEIKDDGNGLVESWIGVSYGNSSSMVWLDEILKRSKKASSFIELIHNAGDHWDVSVHQKIHTNYWRSTPLYRELCNFKSRTVTPQEISKAIEDSDNNLISPGNLFDDEEVISCITVFSVKSQTDYTNSDERIKEAFNIFTSLLDIR